ncbi:MAG: hypothetical protein LBN26_07865 [Christensenellaceae bacterium]|jgi:hypothetical protein|nr:hypothetical protein [Christensenellaceae bacterium]
MEGSKLLRVVSILLIIFGVIGLISSSITAFTMDTVIAAQEQYAELYEQMGIAAMSREYLVMSAVLSIILAVAETAAGILGVLFWAKPARADICVAAGILLLVLCVCSNIPSALIYPEQITLISLLSILLGLLLPALYLAGACKLKKQLVAEG